MEGVASEFFSGTNLSAGVVSTGTQGGTTVVPVDKRFGARLSATPTFLPGGRVQLKVDPSRTSLNATLDNPKVACQIEIAETCANANVVMKLGDTENQLFREFRQGDVSMERWERMRSTGERLKEALGFLYY